MKNPSRNILYTLIAILFTGCSVGPDYKRPPVDTPTAYKEAQGWKIAEPQDDAPRGNWWGIYGDPELNVLISQVEVSNQNVLVAKEQYYLAQGILDQARAGYFPILSAGPSSTRGQGTISSSPVAPGAAIVSPGAPIRTTDRMSFTASWEADIWGQIGRNVEANDAAVVASAADLQAALLSYQSTLVQSYMQLRINDAQRQLLDQTIVVYKRSLQITQDRYEAGVAARRDVAQADTQLKSAQAQALDRCHPQRPADTGGLAVQIIGASSGYCRCRTPHGIGECADRGGTVRLLSGPDDECLWRISEFQFFPIVDLTSSVLVDRTVARPDCF
jgi:outer membrane protein TolC